MKRPVLFPPPIGSVFDSLAEEIFVGGLAVDEKIETYLNSANAYTKYDIPKPNRYPRPWPPSSAEMNLPGE